MTTTRRILYGVVGEGMGHATRSRVVLDHLASRGHEIRVVVSGRAHAYLRDALAVHPQVSVHEIAGFHLIYEGNAVRRGRSIRSNLRTARASVTQNFATYRSVRADFDAELVVSDFESWAFLYAKRHGLPVVSIDNMQIIQRCDHSAAVQRAKGMDAALAKWAVKAKLPGADHYLVTSFFFPPVRKPRTTLVPPILRPAILQAKREPGEHVLVYQTAAANQALVPLLENLPYEFRVYGIGREERRGNVWLRAFSDQGFVDDLRTARCVMAGGGFSLMGEAVHLRVPMLSVPLERQFEQELNARYLEFLGYGRYAERLDADTLTAFIEAAPKHARALEQYIPRDNAILFEAIDELVETLGGGQRRPDVLNTLSLGDSWLR